MILERTLRDRYCTVTEVQLTSASTTKQLILTATYPQKVRVRSIKQVALQGSDGYVVHEVTVSVVPNGQAIPGLAAISAAPAGNSYDYPDQENSTIWSHLGATLDYNSSASAGNGVDRVVWYGDGRVIDLAVGDRIYLLGKSSSANPLYLWLMMDMDIF